MFYFKFKFYGVNINSNLTTKELDDLVKLCDSKELDEVKAEISKVVNRLSLAKLKRGRYKKARFNFVYLRENSTLFELASLRMKFYKY